MRGVAANAIGLCNYPLSISIERFSIPQIYKSKLSRMWEASFLGQFDDLAVHLIRLPLHAVVNPVDLNLQAAGSEHSCAFLGPEGEAGDDQDGQQVSSVKHVN